MEQQERAKNLDMALGQIEIWRARADGSGRVAAVEILKSSPRTRE